MSASNHEDHLCNMVGQKKTSKLYPLVCEPKYICKECLRVANEKASLCDPKKLKPCKDK